MFHAALGDRESVNADAEPDGFSSDPSLQYEIGPLEVMGVRYIALPGHKTIVDPHWTLIEQGVLPPRLNLRGDSQSRHGPIPYSLYENQKALPRAFVLGPSKRIRLADPVAVEELSKLEPREKVLMEVGEMLEGRLQDFKPATIIEYAPTRVVVDAHLDAPGYLVLAEVHAAGWRATVNGQPTSILPADIGFHAVQLSAGTHRIAFTFHPPLWSAGLVLTLATLLVVVILCYRDFAGRNRLPDQEASAAAHVSI